VLIPAGCVAEPGTTAAPDLMVGGRGALRRPFAVCLLSAVCRSTPGCAGLRA